MARFSFKLLLALLIELFNNSSCLAQCQSQSSIQSFPISSKRFYVVVASNETTSMASRTYVRTKRVRKVRTEYLDLLNIFLPNSFVRQKLLDSHDAALATGLYMRDELLVTMAILPDFDSGQVKWIPIKPDTIERIQLLSWQRIADDCYARLFNYKAARFPSQNETRRRMDFIPIIKLGNQYFTTQQQVLTEYFVLRDYPTWYPTSGDNATINRMARAFTVEDYSRELKAVSASAPKSQQALPLREELFNRLLLQQVDGKIYTFWSLPSSITHWGVWQLGAGDLRYQPQVGIISGKYPSYFELATESAENSFFDLISIQFLSN